MLNATAIYRYRRLIQLLTLASTVLLSLPASSEDQGAAPFGDSTFRPMDVFNLEWANDPRVAPDGATIAYSRSGFDVMTDRRVSQIWLADADGGNHRPLVDRAGYSARFSPGGDRVAFLSATEAGTELFMHWLRDNRTARITQLPENPGDLIWSPDGRWLAFSMFEPAKAEPLVKGPSAPEGSSWAPGFKVFETVQYRFDGQGYLRPGFTHVYVVPAEGGSARRVTSGDFHHRGGIAWALDGQSLYVSANRNENWAYETNDSNLYEVSLVDGTVRQLTDRYGPDASPALSPDGRYLAYTGFDDRLRSYETLELYVLELATGEVEALTPDLDRSAGDPVWADNSSGIHVAYDDKSLGQVALVDLKGRRNLIVSDLGGTAISRPYSGGSYHAAGGTLAYTRSQASYPADLSVVRRGRNSQITNLNTDALGHRELAGTEAIRVPSALDGLEIEAWVAKPPDFDPARTYPLILEIHGGPFAAYGPYFSAEVQLYAAAGYLVVYANPRGSSSYGEEFANKIHHAYPGGDFDDLMSVVDFTIAEGWADPERLYVTGGSGGGILTAWIVTQTDRFRAAVAAKPITNWLSFVLTADSYTFFQRYWFASPPWEDPRAYLDRSPIAFVDKVKTPTMLMTGEQDHRTPISEAEQFYQALQLRKIETALVRVPDASHGIAARPSHLISKAQHVLAWFARYSGDT